MTIFLLVLTMLLWSANFFITKIALEYYSPMAVAFWRFFFGLATLLGVLIFFYGRRLTEISISLKSFWFISLVAFFGIFLTIYCFNKGLETASAINGSLILATNPLITAILAYFFLMRKLTRLQVLGIGLSMIGVVVLLVKGDITQLFDIAMEKGDLYILGMALFFSISQIVVDKYLSEMTSILMTTVSAALALLMFAAVAGPELVQVEFPSDFRFWGSAAFMGVLGTGLGYVALYSAVVKLGATTTSLYGNLIPLFTVLLAIPFGEEIQTVQLIGGCVIVSGLMIFGQSKK